MECTMLNGLYDAYKLMEGLVEEGELCEDGGIDGDYPSCDWWYTIEDGYCPTQDRTYITVELKICVDGNDEPIYKVLPIGWYQGEPSEKVTEEYVGELIGTLEY